MTKNKFETKTINFNGDQLTGIKDENGDILVPMRQVCENLGLLWSSQRIKIKNHSILKSSVSMIDTVDSNNKVRKQVLLKADKLPLWLITINPKKVKEELQPKLTEYIEKAADALYEIFMGKGYHINIQSFPEYTDLKNQLDKIYEKIVQDNPKARKRLRVSKFLRDMGLSEREVKRTRLMFGGELKDRYFDRFGKYPVQNSVIVNNRVRVENCYFEKDRFLMQEVYEEIFPMRSIKRLSQSEKQLRLAN